MAGEWIEYEKSLPEKTEVLRIAGVLGMDRYAVVGRLLEIWSWFDSHTEDGNALGVTKVFLDEKVGVTGFCDAVIDAGWMDEIHEPCNGLSVTNFGKHNGKTAKKRLKNNQRVANHRKETKRKQECNAGSVTKSVTTEQNRTYITATATAERDGVTLIQDGKEKFSMFDGWQPDAGELQVACVRFAVPQGEITQEVIAEHAYHWRCKGGMESAEEWTRRLVKNYKLHRDNSKGRKDGKDQPTGKRKPASNPYQRVQAMQRQQYADSLQDQAGH